MSRLALSLHVSLLLCITLATTATAQADNYCYTFRELNYAANQENKHECPSSCTRWPGAYYTKAVVGTFQYTTDSDVCLSAVHAGILQAGQHKNVAFSRVESTNRNFEATMRNRVVSQNRILGSNTERAFFFQPEDNERSPPGSDNGNDVIMVHNNNAQDDETDLKVACILSSRLYQLAGLYKRFYRWNYGAFSTKPLENSMSIYTSVKKGVNARVLRCVSENPDKDVTGIFGQVNDKCTPSLPTVTTSVGSSIQLAYLKESPDHLVRLPGNREERLPLKMSNARVQDTGLYISSCEGNLDTIVRVVVRECPEGRYGVNCARWCPDCLNTGQCHATSGRCVCPAGTMGEQCQQYCENDRYGAECQLRCNSGVLGWEPPHRSNQCRGLTFCTRDPRGCSCMPGYKPPSCNQVCESGYYGPDCALQCHYCINQRCNPTNGACLLGCTVPLQCDYYQIPRNLPRFRNPPNIRDCNHKSCRLEFQHWSPVNDDGEMSGGNRLRYFLQFQDVSYQNQDYGDNKRVLVDRNNMVPYNFVPGRGYNIRLVISTNYGFAETDYNLRLTHTNIRIPCLDDYSDIMLRVGERTNSSFILSGMNSNECTQHITYEIRVVKTISNEEFFKKNFATETALIRGLDANTEYTIVFDGKPHGTVTIKQNPPGSISNLELESFLEYTGVRVRATWSPADSATSYIVTRQLIEYKACRDNREGVKGSINTKATSVTFPDLSAYSLYRICVIGFNNVDRGAELCEEVVTHSRVPSISATQLTCQPSTTGVDCSIRLSGNCDVYNGPKTALQWHLHSERLQCDDSTTAYNLSDDQTINNGRTFNKKFDNLTPMRMYSVRVRAFNDVGIGRQLREEQFTTSAAEAPGPVRNLTMIFTTSNSLALRWRLPCPRNANVRTHRFIVNTFTAIYDANTRCNSDRRHSCFIITNLDPGTHYTVKVQSCSSESYKTCSTHETIDAVTKDRAPFTPSIETISRQPKQVTFNLETPTYLGQNAYCYFTVTKDDKVVMYQKYNENQEENVIIPVNVTGLAPSSKYKVVATCCNEIACGNSTTRDIETTLEKLHLHEQLELINVEDTNATIRVPFISVGDATVIRAVLVSKATGKQETNFTAHYIIWKQKQEMVREDITSRKRRSSSSDDDLNGEAPTSTYVAGQVSQNSTEFLIGGGMQNRGGLSNPPLEKMQAYQVAVVVEATFNDQTVYDEIRLPAPFTAGVSIGLPTWMIGLLFLALIIFLMLFMALLLVKLHRKRKTAKDDAQMKEVIPAEEIPSPKSSPDNNPKLQTSKCITFPSVASILPKKTEPASESKLQVPKENHMRRSPFSSSSVQKAQGFKLPPIEKSAGQSKVIEKNSQHSSQTPSPNKEVTSDSQIEKKKVILGHAAEESNAVRFNSSQSAIALPRPVTTMNPVVALDDEEPIYENLDRSVAGEEFEAYLNKTVGCAEIMHQFSNVPATYPKSMYEGERPQNRLKNRYRNNLPYDETRVLLKILNNDPYSDYINANHVQGVDPSRQYIASQGPKSANDCTIPDFWRMIVEQNVNVIVMVANFVEKNVAKVGLYFSRERPVMLDPLNGHVIVLRSEVKSFCTVSTLEVQLELNNNHHTRQVTHYHYTKWPDHGVPLETYTLAQMLRYIATSHDDMCAVVHGSAGIGRTGTVIYDLLCNDHLLFNPRVDLISVLEQLRSSRARLVENQIQFKLCLQLLDDMLFGFQNATLVAELSVKMTELLSECGPLYNRLITLPTGLQFNLASASNLSPFNRSQDILPADSHRIYFQNDRGETPYINAVRIDGLEDPAAYIVAEHPMLETLERFWSMLVNKKCPTLVLLNSSFNEEYPAIYPCSDEAGVCLQAGSISIKTVSSRSISDDLISRVFTVSNGQWSRTVNVYEVVGWARGEVLPPDVEVLVRIADLILSTTHRISEPPLLVCGDGYTASGLATAVVTVIERMKYSQDIDVYRTAVKLRRCRPQFITDQRQLEQMITAAEIYLSSFQDYSNFI